MSNYLVQYGRPAFVGSFAANSDGAGGFTRGDRVVIRGPRGLELGTVLCQPDERFVGSIPGDGELLRHATPTDADDALRSEAVAADILAAAGEAAAALALAFIDAEVALDRASAILHAIPWAECDATPVLAGLSERFGLPIRLLDLSRSPTSADPPATAGCGKPGCGSGSGGCDSCGTGGGCSTGSCSRGQVKSADELTAYFTNLRKNLESQLASRTPLA